MRDHILVQIAKNGSGLETALKSTKKEIHTEIRTFKCESCGKSFKRNNHLKYHKLVHKSEKPFSCMQCGKTFSQSSNRNTHMKAHNKDTTFSCDQCDAKFYSQNGLKNHTNIIHSGRSFHCDECGQSFTSHSYLNTVHKRKNILVDRNHFFALNAKSQWIARSILMNITIAIQG